MNMENIQYRIKTFSGAEVDVNVGKAENIFQAAEEIQQSVAAGDIKINGVPIWPDDVAVIEDIAG
jgi:hypothetical protein